MNRKYIFTTMWALTGGGLFLLAGKTPLIPGSEVAASTAPATNELLFPTPYNSERDKTGPMPAAEVAAAMKLPPGFKATVFASEPDVQNPIAMAWDGRGRLWIAENYTYAEAPKNLDLNLRDRILIFEDKNADGHFSSRKVFTDKLQDLTSIEVGHGGVWAMCPSQLLFIPDKKGNDVPDGPPVVVLDGFTMPAQNHHNFANGLKFGPDGWLYGRCGHSAPGEIGVPGAAAADRIPLRGTIWRYHPQRKIFESLSAGTTNPWGHDWDEHGELFFINTVNGHLWHEIPGAHYMTSGGNAHTYALIDQHADHFHFDTAQSWTKSRNGAADAFGGGHAHVGMMIYQGDNWPAEYRGHLFTFNMHGYRANQEILERVGSGYVGHHGKDFLFVGDKWFRGIDLGYGPDGGVFALDWSDTGECHESTGVHRTSGRIFKITYGDPKRSEIGDLAKLTASDLVKLHTHLNEWFARQARRQLEDRAADGVDLKDAISQLREMFEKDADVVNKLRALWTLYDIGAADEPFLRAQLRHENEHVRAWAIRLLTDTWPLDTALSVRPPIHDNEAAAASLEPEFIRMAREDASGLVRLVLSSTLQRLPVGQRGALASALVAHVEDAHDHNLPLMIWYGLIPVADSAPAVLPRIAARCELPQTRQFIARRLAEDIETNPAPLNELLSLTAASPSQSLQSDILAGLSEATTGLHKATKPAAWDSLAMTLANSNDATVHDRLRDLNVLFGDAKAIDEVKKIALDNSADIPARQAALQKLIDHRPADLRAICEPLLKVGGLNPAAARGLATFDDPAIGKILLDAYPDFAAGDRPQLIAALVSRAPFAMTLLDAVDAGRIPRAQITPFHARQIHGFNDPALSKRLTAVWGEVRDASADKRPIIAAFKAQLTPAVLAKADKRNGRLLFTNVCSVCHTLYGEGGKIGPDLTGSGRANLDYLLENVVDPSAVVPAEYRMVIAKLKDGRVLNGIVGARTDRTITLRMTTETTTVELSLIERLVESSQSPMPEGLLEGLGDTNVRDLIGYLMHNGQVAK
jgi:putative membrane-bound dehydrogenase-like protein